MDDRKQFIDNPDEDNIALSSDEEQAILARFRPEASQAVNVPLKTELDDEEYYSSEDTEDWDTLLESSIYKEGFSYPYENYDRDLDDSSDEEDVIEHVSKYNIKDKLKEFEGKIQLKEPENKQLNDPTVIKAQEMGEVNFDQMYKLSFLTHAIGSEIFDSREIGNEYYPLKEDLKIPNEAKEKVNTYISDLINSIISKLLLPQSKGDNSVYKPIIDILTEEFYIDSPEFIGDLETLVQGKCRVILMHEECRDRELLQGFDDLKTKISAYISTLTGVNYPKLQQLFQGKENVFPTGKRLPITEEEIRQHPSLTENLTKNKGYIEDKIKTFLRDKGCLTTSTERIKTTKGLKEQIKNIIRINDPNTPFETFILQAVHSSKGVSVKSFINELDIIKATHLLFIESILKEKNRDGSIIVNGLIKQDASISDSSLKAYENALHDFLPFTILGLEKLLKKNIDSLTDKNYNDLIKKSIQDLKAFLLAQVRPTIRNNYEFKFTQKSYSLVKFIANLRLCNRSLKRTIRNDRFIEGGIKKQTLVRSCNFPFSEEAALENQKITNNGNRSDLVINLGAYVKIHGEITSIITRFNKIGNSEIDDKQVALWIRAALMGEKEERLASYQYNEIKRHIVNITYLLFGTEAVRNPASFVHHNMMLDLIINGKRTWKDFLIASEKNKPLMPMEIKADASDKKIGAVKCVRALHTIFRTLLPYPYQYPKDAVENTHPKLIEFISREARLTLEWLKEVKNINISLEDLSKEETQDLVIQTIYEACSTWFKGISFDSKHTLNR